MPKNRLYYGDNLDVLRRDIPDESVDLIYLDPPFNSNRNYNVIFGHESHDSAAQIEAFSDTWTWTPETQQQYAEYTQGGLPPEVADALEAFYRLLGENDAMAYLVNMAPRLVELHRVLKLTGTIYLHCDPTMSHYLKILLDSIFGAQNFINDISWNRSANRSSISRIYRRAHDCILFYAKDRKKYFFDPQFKELSGASLNQYDKEDEGGRYRVVPLLVSGKRNGDTGQPWHGIDPSMRGKAGMHWVTKRENLDEYERDGRVLWPKKAGGAPGLKYYLHESPGVPVSDFWDDIPLISASSKEALGYPTQKPIALLDRIVRASSRCGDVVLDPFCGCGTAVDAAQKLSRHWIGIDITYIAIDLILKRFQNTYGDGVLGEIEVSGIPRDLEGARALFERNPFDFERWAVSLVGAQPHESQKQRGDHGIDGVATFPTTNTERDRIIVSVKGGQRIGVAMVRDLRGTIEREKAAMGILITLTEPTRGMLTEANHSGSYRLPSTGQPFPRIQVVTIGQLLNKQRPRIPQTFPPYIRAKWAPRPDTQQKIF